MLDVANNEVLINYGSGTDPISTIAGWIACGHAAGAWNGSGIISSVAQTNTSYGLGYADSADAGNPANLASGQIEILYTLLGDANLDGKVNGTDFNLMAANFNQAVTNGWDRGDFNYDGAVNGSDFVLLAGNFNQAAQIAVPAVAPVSQTAASTASANASGVASLLTQRRRAAKNPCGVMDANREENSIKDPDGNHDCRGAGDVGVRPPAQVHRFGRAGAYSVLGQMDRSRSRPGQASRRCLQQHRGQGQRNLG